MADKSALIVDDSATARIMLAKVLNSMDVATKHAKSGEEALTLLKTDRPDLIFLDHLMPGMDGFQTLKAIKNHPDTQNIPVVMYTSQNALKYREEARALGAAGVITKQIDREQLYLLVEKIWMQNELAQAEPLLTDEVVMPATAQQGMRTKVVELRPSSYSHNPNPSPAETALQDARNELKDYVERQVKQMRERQRRETNRYKNLLIILLAAFSLYAMYLVNTQHEQINRLETQIDANRSAMQEMVDIMERTQ